MRRIGKEFRVYIEKNSCNTEELTRNCKATSVDSKVSKFIGVYIQTEVNPKYYCRKISFIPGKDTTDNQPLRMLILILY